MVVVGSASAHINVLRALTSHVTTAGEAGAERPAATTAALAASESPAGGKRRAVVVAGARTPFVKSFGKLMHLDAIGLAVASVKGLLGQLEPALDPDVIDEVVFGNVVVKSSAPNIARELILDAGLPKHISGTTVICQCLSGLECVAQAARLIETEDASCVIAGGSDSTSSGEIALHRSLSTVLGEYVMGGGNKKGLAGLLKLLRGVAGATKLPQQPSIAERSTGRTMGYHADLMAEINGVERPEQDAWAIDSHNKACAARSAGLLAEEIVAVAGADGGELVEDDELIREGMTTQQLAKLKGVFRDQGARAADESAGVDGSGAGTVTAASSSALTDGASAVLVMEEGVARAAGYNADIVVVTYVKTAVDPFPQLLLAPALAIPAALKKAGLRLEDIDIFEIHEAFAAQVLATLACLESEEFARDWLGQDHACGSIPRNKINPNGSSIAIGHPFAATGGRLVGSLANTLRRTGQRYGLISICAAGGMGGVMILENTAATLASATS